MARITALRGIKGRRTWVEVVVDGQPLCALPQQSVLQFGLREGIELPPTTVNRLLEEAAYREAMRTALRYLEHRSRSQVEVERRLGRDRLPALAIERVVVRLTDLGYLDDLAFAASFARDRIRLRPCAPRHIRHELRAKGVDDDGARAGVETAMEELGETGSSLLERVARHQSDKVNPDDPVGRRRFIGRLQRRGFRTGEIVRWMGEDWRTDTEGR